MSDPGGASSTWTVEIVGHVVIKRKSCRKALVKFDGLVMLMTIEKPKDKGKVDAKTIMLDLVDRPDEVVVGTTGRVVKARIVYHVPKEQRDGARDVRSTGNESWQQTSAEIAEGELVNAACEASVKSTGKVMELREDKARLVLYQARSRTREVRILQRLRGMSCGSAGRRGVKTSWQGVPIAHRSGYDVRRRGPAKIARRRSDSRQQPRPQERRQLRRARHRLQGLS